MKTPVLTAILAFTATALHAADAAFTVEKNDHGISVKVNGQPFANYVIDAANEPFLWPIYGPTGKAMTRAWPRPPLSSGPNPLSNRFP